MWDHEACLGSSLAISKYVSSLPLNDSKHFCLLPSILTKETCADRNRIQSTNFIVDHNKHVRDPADQQISQSLPLLDAKHILTMTTFDQNNTQIEFSEILQRGKWDNLQSKSFIYAWKTYMSTKNVQYIFLNKGRGFNGGSSIFVGGRCKISNFGVSELCNYISQRFPGLICWICSLNPGLGELYNKLA